MNERIKQLAEQAGYMEDCFGIGHWDMPECKKFAQLIVQECLNAIVATNQRPSNEKDLLMFSAGLLTAIDGIKKHFGVEE